MAKTRTWFPRPSEIFLVNRKNTSYIHSLWVGVTAPIFNFPVMMFEEIVLPLIRGVCVVSLAVVMSVLAGVCGIAVGIKDNDEQV